MKRKEFESKVEKLGCGFLLKESPLFNLDEGKYSEYHLEILMSILVMTLEEIYYKGDEYKLKSISFREVTENDKEFREGQNIYLLTYTQFDEEIKKEAEYNIGSVNMTPALCGYDYQEQDTTGFIPLSDLEKSYGEYYGKVHYFFNYRCEFNLRIWGLYRQDIIEKMKIGDTIRFPYTFDDIMEVKLINIDSSETEREFTENPRNCMRSSKYYFEYRTDEGRNHFYIDSFEFDLVLFSDRKKFC